MMKKIFLALVVLLGFSSVSYAMPKTVDEIMNDPAIKAMRLSVQEKKEMRALIEKTMNSPEQKKRFEKMLEKSMADEKKQQLEPSEQMMENIEKKVKQIQKHMDKLSKKTLNSYSKEKQDEEFEAMIVQEMEKVAPQDLEAMQDLLKHYENY